MTYGQWANDCSARVEKGKETASYLGHPVQVEE